ncbi:toll-like receptor 2 [Sitophilus oryzae]|uniref:Toll-like receptor 2 n=1 Tax=Sitophilus oryzae TaxID=7048 RepID=A0A6J2Y8X6_SITOR|nr:toll-like receptor 2 [Sitophilus oryzae]
MHFLWLLLAFSSFNLSNCYEECDEDICPPVVIRQQIPNLEQLPPLLGEDKATGCLCRGFNDTRSVCFGRSGCTRMPKFMKIQSPWFKLTNTHITKLLPGDFDQIEHLRDLQIEGNYELEFMSPGLFQNLSSLVNLSISFNTKLKTLSPDTFTGLTALRRLFLKKNGFDTIHDITINLKPSMVPNIKTLILDWNSFAAIQSNDFLPMTNSTLQELSLIFCRIDNIDQEAFVPLKNLRALRLGENTISSDQLSDLFERMFEANIDLKVLNLFYMGFKKYVPKRMMEVIAKMNVSHLNLSRNRFEVLKNESFPYMPNLEYLDLREILPSNISEDAFLNFPNLKTLLLSANKLTSIPKAVFVLQNLIYLDAQENSPAVNNEYYFRLQYEQFSNMKKLVYLNINFNGLSHLFNTSFVGLTHLEVLELKNCSVFHIENNTFLPLENLKMLNLANNYLLHDDTIPNVFWSLTKLEVLLLGGCKLKYISSGPSNPFRNLKNLKYLGLDKNFFTAISPTDFLPLKSIIQIDLSSNLLNSWEHRILSSNENITKLIVSRNKISDITLAMYQDFSRLNSVDLDQNVIHCSCFFTYEAYRTFTKDNYSPGIKNGSVFQPPLECTYPDSLDNVTLMDYLTRKEYAESICVLVPEGVYLFLPLSIIAILLSILAGLAFYYRWHIKYWIFLSKLYLSRKGKIRPKREKTGYTNYEYDAFVSYSNEDRDFVVKMVTMLENNEPFFRLCVYERDFQIGTIISESILESVAKSRKTLLVISDNYAKSQWCRWESQICDHHRLFFENEDGEYVDDSLILIKLTSVSEHHLTPTLKYLLKTRIYLQWEFDEGKQRTFWDRLRNTLGPTRLLSEVTRM